MATKLRRPDQIVWHEIERDRLVDCKLYLDPRFFDIIGVYQHPWTPAVVQISFRKEIWVSLDKLLKEIPNRNSLCILGDFNCSLPNIPHLIKQAHFKIFTGNKLGPQHGDSFPLTQLMNDFQLVALNIWTPHLGALFFPPLADF